MRPGASIKHRLFRCAAAFSALLCLVTVALWARSAWASDLWQRSSSHLQGDTVTLITDQVSFGSGTIWMHHSYCQWPLDTQELREDFARHHPNPAQSDTEWFHKPAGPYLSGLRDWGSFLERLGFLCRYEIHDGPSLINRSRIAMLPYWAILLAGSITFALVAVPLRTHATRMRRQRDGKCVFCGYDLRATSDRCPECGKSAEFGKTKTN